MSSTKHIEKLEELNEQNQLSLINENKLRFTIVKMSEKVNELIDQVNSLSKMVETDRQAVKQAKPVLTSEKHSIVIGDIITDPDITLKEGNENEKETQESEPKQDDTKPTKSRKPRAKKSK